MNFKGIEGMAMKRVIAGLGCALLGLAGFAAAQADTVINVTQYSYNYSNQVVCTAVRMNMAITQPTDACTVATTVGSNGPDRITANIYDAAGQLTAIEQAYGTSNVRVYAGYTYTNNGLKQTETDANNNTTTFTYDGFDRLVTLQYPNTTLSSGTSSTSDYETFTYDANDNRKTWRRRNNQTITYTYDNLNREVIADIPAHPDGAYNATEKDIYTTYDAFGRVTKKAFASYTGSGVSYTYNGLGWVATTTDMNNRTISYLYNTAGARLRLTDQEGYYVVYGLDNLNRIQKATLNGTTNVLFSYTYNAIGQMTQLTKGVAGTGGGTTTYAYDDLGRVQGMAVDQATTGYDITWGKVGTTGAVAYNAANQITTWASSSNIFDYVETTTANENRSFDGLNRDAGLATVAGGYDANGNLAKDNPRAFVYDIYNRLLTATGGANNISLVYDPEGRLVQTTTALGSKEYLYDGTNLITEYSNGGTTPASRYIHGSGTDNPIVWLKGSDDSDRRYYYTNYQGSVVGYVGAAGQFVTGGLTKYNAYGQPQNSANAEVWPGTRFGYTGQVILPDAYLYYYKARIYDPKHGRFLQTDPVGSVDDLNLYAYTADDPINRADPDGTEFTFIGGAGVQGDYLKGFQSAFSDAGIQNVNVPEGQPGTATLAGDVLGVTSVNDLKFANSLIGTQTINDLAAHSNSMPDGEQFNLGGYSYGSAAAASAAYAIAQSGGHVDNLVLVGAPINKDLMDAVTSNPNIKNVINIDLSSHGDPIRAGMNDWQIAGTLPTLVGQMKDNAGHFYYSGTGATADDRRKALANELVKRGVR